MQKTRFDPRSPLLLARKPEFALWARGDALRARQQGRLIEQGCLVVAELDQQVLWRLVGGLGVRRLGLRVRCGLERPKLACWRIRVRRRGKGGRDMHSF